MKHFKITFTDSTEDSTIVAATSEEALSDFMGCGMDMGCGMEVVQITPFEYIEHPASTEVIVKVSKPLRLVRIFDGILWHELDADAVTDERDGFSTLEQWPEPVLHLTRTPPEWENTTLDAALDLFDEWHGTDLSGHYVLEYHLER